jgi:REP element-mobilizing transposase RayT
MILARHLVWTAYGWWFPNDPRGSWSKEVWTPAIRGLGTAGNPSARGRRTVQPSPDELQHWLQKAQRFLKHPPVLLDTSARELARNAIMQQVKTHGYVVAGFAVMPEHVHVVVERHQKHTFQRMVQAFKSVSSRALRKHFLLAALPARRSRRDSCKSGCATRAAGSAVKRPIWSRGYWVRYLDTDNAVAAAIAYVRRQT